MPDQKSRDSEEFLPNDEIARFVNKDQVEKVLRFANLGTDTSLIDFVSDDANQLFLILVSMSSKDEEQVSFLEALKAHLFTNKSLPITFQGARNAVGDKVFWWQPYSPSGGDCPRLPLHIQRCGRIQKDLFQINQWRFIAPVFGTGQDFRFHFRKSVVLPYLEVKQRVESRGFFGEVLQVIVHAAHINAPNLIKTEDGSVAVALKKANDDPELRKFFDKEANNLERFRNFKSNHLIKPIAAYEQDQDRCLLFPWAEGGNLAQYWRRTPGASLNNFELAWVFGQLTGLFEALEELHGKNCRHGDLKPENILVFIDADKNKSLQIADMGLTTFHELEAATGIRRAHEILTLTPPGTSRYEPPEMDINRNKKLPAHETRSRAYDIWSMGCVVLELLIWLACGFETVKAFRGGTAYFWEWNDDEKKYCVGSDTRDHITTLATKWQAQSAWRELLELVESRLLVVDVSKDSKSSSPECREIASAAHRQMRGIQEKYYLASSTTGDGLALGHDYEHNMIKRSLPSYENNLDEFGGLVGIERKATEELEPNPDRSLPEGKDTDVTDRLDEVS
ncbi:hypothetical protein CaCOL14_010209 [Colletotrichum acutatum]